MTYERTIDAPRAEAIPVSMALHASEADHLRVTIDQGLNAARDLFDEGVGVARDAIQAVPARAWRIGAIVAGAAASLAVGAYAMFSRGGASRKRKTAARRPATRSRKASPRAKTA